MSRDREIAILSFGTTGQLARALIDSAKRDNHIALTAVPRAKADFFYPDQVRNAIMDARDVDLVVNAVAYTAVDKAEGEEAVARRINAESVEAMASACRARALPLIHVSTDYVFDGAKLGPYREDDPVAPLNAYGRSKLAGEDAIRGTLEHHVILRTSWVYSAIGTNFVKTMLRLGVERDELKVIADQYGAPTSADSLTRAILTMADRISLDRSGACFGTFHYADAGETTWYGFAEEIFARVADRIKISARILPTTSAGYPTPARRPQNSRLDCSKIERIHRVTRPDWRMSLVFELEKILAMQDGRPA